MKIKLTGATLLITVFVISGCSLQPAAGDAVSSQEPAVTDTPDSAMQPIEPTVTTKPASIPTVTPFPTPTTEPSPEPIDYSPVIAELEAYLTNRVYDQGFDLGVAFVDVETGFSFHIRGDRRYHAMSTFKGPLAVMYYQLIESGDLQISPTDARHLDSMLSVSYNQSTTCIMERVGGVPAFNDWLADQGFTRELSFVFSWEVWPCPNNEGNPGVELVDWRYARGDEELGLPDKGLLLYCDIPQLPCDKGMAPIEIAEFYARLDRGELINEGHLAELYRYMERSYNESVFLNDLPEDAQVNVYTKGGNFQATEVYRVHFFSEAGVIQTSYGTFTVAMYMQRQPEWPGTWPMSHAVRIFYDFFVAAHGGEDTG